MFMVQVREWGMKGLQDSFPWCKKRLPGNSEKQKLVIQSNIMDLQFQN